MLGNSGCSKAQNPDKKAVSKGHVAEGSDSNGAFVGVWIKAHVTWWQKCYFVSHPETVGGWPYRWWTNLFGREDCCCWLLLVNLMVRIINKTEQKDSENITPRLFLGTWKWVNTAVSQVRSRRQWNKDPNSISETAELFPPQMQMHGWAELIPEELGSGLMAKVSEGTVDVTQGNPREIPAGDKYLCCLCNDAFASVMGSSLLPLRCQRKD